MRFDIVVDLLDGSHHTIGGREHPDLAGAEDACRLALAEGVIDLRNEVAVTLIPVHAIASLRILPTAAYSGQIIQPPDPA